MVRFKNRYLLCELQPYTDGLPLLQTLTEKHLANLLRDELLSNFGDLGLAKVYFSFQVKYWNKDTQLAIFRVPRDHVNLLTTTLAMITSIQGNLVKFKVIHCSGTIKKSEIATVHRLKTWINARIRNGEIHTLAEAQKAYEATKPKGI